MDRAPGMAGEYASFCVLGKFSRDAQRSDLMTKFEYR
jgi:hypothetical protein